MKKNNVIICSIIIAILLITVVIMAVCVAVFKPKDLSNYISTENISQIVVSTSVPEDYNKKIEFNLTADESSNLVKLIKAAKVERKLGKNDYDEVGCNIKIAYADGSSLEIPYRYYVMLKDKWYGVDGYVFDYIYETTSYKEALEVAKNS